MDTMKCFVIMPISDAEGYEKGHFTRVYEHLIKPAILSSGFEPVRADEKKNTNYIVIDILKMILESDMVICDLSSRNANVLYELGIRQAFNKKALLLKDRKTEKVFDIQGLRYIEYDESLRVDEVKKDVVRISESIIETHQAHENEVNSLIQLLSIKPASISNSVELSNETSLILKAIESIDDRLNNLEKKSPVLREHKFVPISKDLNNERFDIGNYVTVDNKEFGQITNVLNDGILIRTADQNLVKMSFDDPQLIRAIITPF